jgi:hypothetical protein
VLVAALPPAPRQRPVAPAQATSLAERAVSLVASALVLPSAKILEARIAGLSKAWTWGASGLLVLAAYGYASARSLPGVKPLAAALAITFGFFLVPFDQGHGWGYRYLHSAWFALPVLAGLAMTCLPDAEMRNMAGWAVILSLVGADALRLAQVEFSRAGTCPGAAAGPRDPGRTGDHLHRPRAGSYTRDTTIRSWAARASPWSTMPGQDRRADGAAFRLHCARGKAMGRALDQVMPSGDCELTILMPC